MSSINSSPNTYSQTSELYKNTLKDIETNFNITIESLIKSYPQYKLYPNVTELENIYSNNLYNLEDVKNKFFNLYNNIENNNKLLENVVNNKNKQFEKLKIDNQKLKTKYNMMSGSDQSSIGLREQIQDEYRQSYLSLVILTSFALLYSFIGFKQIIIHNV